MKSKFNCSHFKGQQKALFWDRYWCDTQCCSHSLWNMD